MCWCVSAELVLASLLEEYESVTYPDIYKFNLRLRDIVGESEVVCDIDIDSLSIVSLWNPELCTLNNQVFHRGTNFYEVKNKFVPDLDEKYLGFLKEAVRGIKKEEA